MSARKIMWMVGTLVMFALFMQAQEAAKPEIKHVPVKATSAASGKQMYTSYCAVCHGTDGKGAGPAAEALKTPPTDLTMLAKHNGGNFPGLKVSSSIRGEANIPAHGTKD